MKYQEALEEFNQEDENGRSRLVYAYFGLAVYFGQILEEALTQMLWMHRFFKQKNQTNKILNLIIEEFENSKKTMGNMINEVKQAYSLSTEIELKLKEAVTKRNYLIHRYFKDQISKCYSIIGQKEMLQYFCDFIDQVSETDTSLKPYFAEYMKNFGLTDEKLQEYMALMKNEERRRDS